MNLILWLWPMQLLNLYISYINRCSNPSVISFSSTEMAANMVNWAKLWANWFLMQLENTFIVETESLNQLTSEEQRLSSEDQKNSSVVAKVHYQKRRSGEVAVKAHECLQKQAKFVGSDSSSILSGETIEKASLPPPERVSIPLRTCVSVRGNVGSRRISPIAGVPCLANQRRRTCVPAPPRPH